jgi:hypothetical protein
MFLEGMEEVVCFGRDRRILGANWEIQAFIMGEKFRNGDSNDQRD